MRWLRWVFLATWGGERWERVRPEVVAYGAEVGARFRIWAEGKVRK